MGLLRSKTEKRTHCVSVRLSDKELELLDSVRRHFQRGVALRHLALDTFPPLIPEVNRELHANLNRALGNISALAAASRKGGFIPESELLPALHRLRLLLIAAEADFLDGGEK